MKEFVVTYAEARRAVLIRSQVYGRLGLAKVDVRSGYIDRINQKMNEQDQQEQMRRALNQRRDDEDYHETQRCGLTTGHDAQVAKAMTRLLQQRKSRIAVPKPPTDYPNARHVGAFHGTEIFVDESVPDDQLEMYRDGRWVGTLLIR